FSTYLGGSDVDAGNAVAVDSAGSIYVAGDTASANFPTVSAYKIASQGGQDVFVTKFTPAGTAIAYSTYLGGNSTDHAAAIAVNAAGNAFVTGGTTSANFPVVNPAQSTIGGS